MTERPRDLESVPWMSVRAYAELYDVDPRTVRKWAAAGLITLLRITLPGKRATVRVQNTPPKAEAL